MTDERPLPHNLGAERALLGAVLVAPEWFPTLGWLPDDAFFRDAHQRIWKAYRRLDADGSPIDLLTLKGALERAGDLEAAGWPGGVVTLPDGVPRSTNAEHYASLVRDAYASRQRIGIYEGLINSCYAPLEEAGEAIAEAEGELARLETISRGTAPLSAEAQVWALVADLEREQAGPLLSLGLPALDDQIGGVQPGEVLGIMARPGLGKTLILCHIITSLVAQHSIACFSLEMPAAQIIRRLARMQFGLSHHALRQGRLNATAYQEWFAGLWLDATPSLSVPQMASRVRRLKAQQKPVRVVCVDHLGLIGGDRGMTTYDRVSTQARELKDVAKREDVAVLVLVQVNRDAGGDGSRELHLGSARDSGVIEEALDYAIALRRLDRSTTISQQDRERYRDVIFAKLLKHRHGAVTGEEVAYRLHAETLRLQEDAQLKAESSDLAAIAAAAGRRR